MKEKQVRFISIVTMLFVCLVLFFAESRVPEGISSIIFIAALAIVLLFLVGLEMISKEDSLWAARLLRWSVLFSLALYVIIFSMGYGILSLAFGFAVGVVAVGVYHFNKSRWRSWAAGFGILAIFFFGTEFLLARYFPLEAGRWGELPALQLHPTRGFSLKPNQRTHLKWNRYDYVVDTNSLGLNSPEIDIKRPTPDTLRILVVGDGITMPNGLGYPDAYPALLEKLLTERLKPRKVQVINAGVTAYCPVEIIPLLDEIGPVFTPDIVLYQFSPSEFDEIGRNRMQLLMGCGLIPKDRPLRYRILESSQVLERYQQVYNKINAILKGKSSGRLQRGLRSRYYHKNGGQLYSEDNLTKLEWHLRKMKTICENMGSQFVMFYVPEVVEVLELSNEALQEREQDFSGLPRDDLNLPYAQIRMLADDLEIPLTDLTPALISDSDRVLYIHKSRHWNRDGHRTAAKSICEALLDMNPGLRLK